MRKRFIAWGIAGLAMASACTDDDASVGGGDASTPDGRGIQDGGGYDATLDGAYDSGQDAGQDVGDAGQDAADDAGQDAGDDAGLDAGGGDAGQDAGDDAGLDAGSDAGQDAGGPSCPGTARCDGDTAICEAADGGTTSMNCPLGCNAGKCRTLTPSNLPPDICDTPGTKDYTGGFLPGTCDATVHQNGGPDICVFKFANVSGDITRDYLTAIAIVATNTMTLGTMHVYPFGATPFVNDGTGVLSCPDGTVPGGGGGSYGTAGGGPGAGVVFGNDAIVPLLPGGNGSGPVTWDPQNNQGSSGGGAIQFVSCGALVINGAITANGDNGYPSYHPLPAYHQAGGGGAGGSILIEAASVSMAPGSALQANGGYGSGGWGAYCNEGSPGGQGATSTSPAGGPSCSLPPPEAGTCWGITGGAGGGGLGRIRINVRAGTTPSLLGSMSPMPSIGTVATH